MDCWGTYLASRGETLILFEIIDHKSELRNDQSDCYNVQIGYDSYRSSPSFHHPKANLTSRKTANPNGNLLPLNSTPRQKKLRIVCLYLSSPRHIHTRAPGRVKAPSHHRTTAGATSLASRFIRVRRVESTGASEEVEDISQRDYPRQTTRHVRAR